MRDREREVTTRRTQALAVWIAGAMIAAGVMIGCGNESETTSPMAPSMV